MSDDWVIPPAKHSRCAAGYRTSMIGDILPGCMSMLGLPVEGIRLDVVIYHPTNPALDLHTEGTVIAVNQTLKTYDVKIDPGEPIGEVRQLGLFQDTNL